MARKAHPRSRPLGLTFIPALSSSDTSSTAAPKREHFLFCFCVQRPFIFANSNDPSWEANTSKINKQKQNDFDVWRIGRCACHRPTQCPEGEAATDDSGVLLRKMAQGHGLTQGDHVTRSSVAFHSSCALEEAACLRSDGGGKLPSKFTVIQRAGCRCWRHQSMKRQSLSCS